MHALRLEVFWGDRRLSVDVLRSPRDLTAWGIGAAQRTAWGFLLDGRRVGPDHETRFRTAEGLVCVACALPSLEPGVRAPLLGAWWRTCAAVGIGLLFAALAVRGDRRFGPRFELLPFQLPTSSVFKTLPPVRFGFWSPWKPKAHLLTREAPRPLTVENVVANHLWEVRGCYERALLRLGPFAGTLTLQWTIDKTGRAAGVVAVGHRIGDPTFMTCVATRVKQWAFPPGYARAAKVTYPFTLSAVGF